MDESGISINEACAKRAEVGSGYLTDEDFANQCNPDGTVKQTNRSTTFSIKDSDSSATVNNTYLYLGGLMILAIVALLIWTVIRRNQNHS